MFYKKRMLRRLWHVEVYNGKPDDPDNPDATTHEVTLVAWNAVAATRLAGRRVATIPTAICYVTWPEKKGAPIFRIENTGGPTTEEIVPSIAIAESDE